MIRDIIPGKRLYAFDVEVDLYDWLFVAKEVGSHDYTVIHNNPYKLKSFMQRPDIVVAGFNNKHYDNWIIQAILYGADNELVKEINDFIITERQNGWEHPFMAYKKRLFDAIDIRDDLPVGLSLENIEGNMQKQIISSTVGFNLNRAWTDQERRDQIRYCKSDVDTTEEIILERETYINTKLKVAEQKNMDPIKAVGLTNAKLTAEFLDARPVNRTDEFDYKYPETLQIEKYKHVVEFFDNPVEFTINQYKQEIAEAKNLRRERSLKRRIAKLIENPNPYDCELVTDIAGVRHVYGWGGIHGAKTKYLDRSDEENIILLVDAGSYYPSLMIEYDYISRNIPSKKNFVAVYKNRQKIKHIPEMKSDSNAQKLVLNTAYGAMKNRYNNLYDPRSANSVCIGGQLLSTDLIEKLEVIPGFELPQSNTDGIMIKVPRKHLDQAHEIIAEWEQRARMKMEYTVVKRIAQKDVNNFIIEIGEVYEINDGVKKVVSPDKGYIEAKGGWVSRYKGGDMINNSISITHKALVDYFIHDIPIEETINNETDIFKFQFIAKTGSTYDATVHYVNDLPHMVGKVNRVYATQDPTYGTLKKLKTDGKNVREDKIASLPDHCLIDNHNTLTVDDIDKQFYIDMTKERAVNFVGKKNIEKMKQFISEKPKKEKEHKTMTDNIKLLSKINDVRLEFAGLGIEKKGVNRYAEYKYFELEDIIPNVLRLNKEHKIMTQITFDREIAKLTVYDLESSGQIEFSSPMVFDAIPKGATGVQNLGAVQTYMRRYLYMLYLEIVENDELDATLGKPEPETAATVKENKKATIKTPAKKNNRPASPQKREAVKQELLDKDGEATKTQLRSIQAGLKKLRAAGTDHEDFIKQCIINIKKGIDKTEAEAMLLEISGKLK